VKISNEIKKALERKNSKFILINDDLFVKTKNKTILLEPEIVFELLKYYNRELKLFKFALKLERGF
jgi:hypothetical protein